MALVQCPDCGSDVSSQAPACPRCGRPMVNQFPIANQSAYVPKKPHKSNPLLTGCAAILGVSVLIAIATAIFDSPSSSRSRSVASTDTAQDDLRARATTKLLSTTEWSDPTSVA